MEKLITMVLAFSLFLLGGCATFRSLQADSSIAWKKTKSVFSRGSSTDNATVRAAQVKLKARGYHSGSVDAVMGPQTVHALRRYQAANGLRITGEVDEGTLVSLGVQ